MIKKPENLEINEYFSSLVPKIDESEIIKNISEARKMM
jgi:hypothetical protein